MPGRLSNIEIQVIQMMLEKHPAGHIANIISQPISVVKSTISELIEGTGRKTFAQKQQEAELKKLNDKRFKEQEKQEERRRKSAALFEHEMKNKRDNSPQFQTRTVDYSQLRTIRIDAKTYIFIKPGEDPKQAKEKFMSTHKPVITVAERPWQKLKHKKD